MRNSIGTGSRGAAIRRWSTAGWVVVSLVVGAACGGSAGTGAPIAAATAAASAAAATATAKPTDSGPTAANPVTVRAAIQNTLTYAPLYSGVEQGIYLKHGIDLKLDVQAAAADTLKAMTSGQAQFSVSTTAAALTAISQGIPLKLFMPVDGRSDVVNYDAFLSFAVRPGIAATTVAQLKGLKVGATFGGNVEVYAREHLKRAGLNPDTDIKFQNVANANALAALQSQAIDAAVVGEPYGSQIVAQIPGARTILRGGGVSDGRIWLLAPSSWLAQNPVLADRVVAATAEAAQYVRKNPGQAAVSVSHYLSTIDLTTLTGALKFIDYDLRWSPKLQQAVDDAANGLFASKVITSLPKSADILALDVLTGYEKKYPDYFSDLK